jgi:hypothetical protein
MIADFCLFILMCVFAYIITVGWMFSAIYCDKAKYLFFPGVGYVSWFILAILLNWMAFN